MLWRTLTLLTVFAISAPTWGGTDSSIGSGKRGKVIDFEDEVVEGLNRRPLDSLSQISERDKRRKKAHLYRKRAGFRPETSETLRVLKYTP